MTDVHYASLTSQGIDRIPDKVKLDYLQLLYCEFQKYEVMTVVGGQPKKRRNPSYKATKHIERTFLIFGYF